MHCAFRLPGLHFPPLGPQTAEHKPRQLSQGELKLETVLGLSVKSLRQLVNFSGTNGHARPDTTRKMSSR